MTSPNLPMSDLEKGYASHSSTPSTPTKCSQIGSVSPTCISPVQKILEWRPWKRKVKSKARRSRIRKLEDKDRGYRSLSTFLDSDENFMLYRRFGYLHSRMLLRKQDQLRKLEAELDDIDDEDADGCPQQRKRLMSRDVDEAADRREPAGVRTRTMIQDEIEQKLEQYDDWILKAQKMVALNKPATRDYKSVEAYIFNKKPLVDEECGFIYNREDLITLRDGREVAVLDTFTEKMLQLFHCSLLQRIFCTKEDRERTTDPDLHYYSKSRKDFFVTSILTIVLLCLLVAPVVLLFKYTVLDDVAVTYASSMGVLLGFTLVFSAVLTLFTQAKRHEIFGAAAAYCAVLVVFITNIPGAK